MTLLSPGPSATPYQRPDGVHDRAVQDRTDRPPRSDQEQPDQGCARDRAAWVHWYNATRLYIAIGYVPPIEDEEHHDRQAGATVPAVALSVHPIQDGSTP